MVTLGKEELKTGRLFLIALIVKRAKVIVT